MLLLLVVALAPAPRAHGAARPALAVEAVAERAATLSGTVPRLRGDRWAAYVAYRRTGRSRWLKAPVERRRAVTVELGPLRPATRYAVRLVVTRCGGCRTGTRRSPTRPLTTRAAPAPLPLPPRAPDPPPPPPVEVTATTASAPAPEPEPEPVAPPTPALLGYGDPLHPSSLPDPMVLRDGDAWFAYGTGERFPMLRSADGVTWTPAGTALASRPTWALDAEETHPWAPSVLATDGACPGTASERCFLLFHTSLSDRVEPTTNCVGVAASPTPEGPFAELGILDRADGERPGGRPIGCGDDAGYGNIDAAPFVDDDGRAWLYVSTDWDCTGPPPCELAPTISVIPLTADLVHASGPREPLLAGRPGSWEEAPWAPVVENPWVVRRGATYHLLFSAGSWRGDYGMGHATAPSPTGPFTRSSDEPWVSGTDTVLSAGGGMLVTGADGRDLLAYHARTGSLDAPRTLRLDPVRWSDDERPAR